MNEPNQYPCHGFNSSLPKGKASGQLQVCDGFIQFHIGEQQGRIPLDDCTMALGGASDRLVFINHHSIADWKICTSDRSILKNPSITAHPTLGPIAKQAHRKRLNGWYLIAAVALLIVCLPMVLLLKMDWVSASVAKQVPPTWEAQLGESALAQYKISANLMDEDRARALLSPLTSPIVDATSTSNGRPPEAFHFYITHDSSPNAFALPGGFVVIHSGLILQSASAEELLGVLGHEISHVTLQHGLRNIIGTAGLYLVITAALGDASGLLATVAGSAPFLLSQSYSRKFERQADEAGYKLLVQANIQPTGLATFFERLMLEEQKRLEEIEDQNTRDLVEGALGFLSTHPASETRVAYLKNLPNPVTNALDLELEFEALKAAVRDFTENTVAQRDTQPDQSNIHP